MSSKRFRTPVRAAFAVVIGMLAGLARAQSDLALVPAPAPAVRAVAARAPALAGEHKVSPFKTQRVTAKAQHLYAGRWGVDKLRLVYTSSGNLIRFSYRVLDAELAKGILDKAAEPYLVAPRSNAVLHVPMMDKVGTLRQTPVPTSGQEYWMVFSNKGNLVRPGERVNVIIGQFRADGLMVD